MTTAQLDHLRKIDAHLERLLEIAAKRTPGRWEHGSECVWAGNEKFADFDGDEDPAFIAACSNNAEAGWESVRGEISDLIEFDTNCRGWKDDNGCAGAAIQHIQLRMAKILARWPLESLLQTAKV